MKTKKQELRELVNQKMPERVKLEFGCEVERTDSKRIQVIDCEKSEDKQWRVSETAGFYGKYAFYSEDRWWDILGKPVTLQDVLRMVSFKHDVKLGGKDEIIIQKFSNPDIANYVFIDISKEIEEQDDEVIDKIIKLIK